MGSETFRLLVWGFQGNSAYTCVAYPLPWASNRCDISEVTVLQLVCDISPCFSLPRVIRVSWLEYSRFRLSSVTYTNKERKQNYVSSSGGIKNVIYKNWLFAKHPRQWRERNVIWMRIRYTICALGNEPFPCTPRNEASSLLYYDNIWLPSYVTRQRKHHVQEGKKHCAPHPLQPRYSLMFFLASSFSI